MAIFSWANPKSIEIPGALAPDRPLYIISDLHLGDGTRSDAFMGKDRQLLAFLQKVRSEGAHLVINGDALDFHQAWSFTRILRAHSDLLGELSRMADTTGVTYIWGNHDYDIQLFKDILRFRVLSSLDLGTTVRIVHGYEFDPFIGPHLEQSHVATRIHHFIERITGAWIRLPLENFYSPANRFTFWLIFNLMRLGQLRYRALRRLGFARAGAWEEMQARYWTQNQLGDPQCIWNAVRDWVTTSPYTWTVTGHSHMPGLVEITPGRFYVNTGSWTFQSSQYAYWDGTRFAVRDWLSGREFDDRAYRSLVDRRFQHLGVDDWWRENYLGWFRFRGAEERRLRPHEWRIDPGAGRPGPATAPAGSGQEWEAK